MSATATVTRVIEVDVRASATAAAQIKAIAQSMQGVEQQAAKTKTATEGIFNGMQSAAKAVVGLFAVDKLMEFGAAINDINDKQMVLVSRMKLVLGSTEAAKNAFGEITRIAREQGKDFDAVGKLYEKISRQQESFGLTTLGVTKLTEGFTASLRLSGAGTNESAAAILQFSQALASGRLQGDEFRSMMENNSVFMYELAKAAGVTTGKLKEMSKDGTINLEFLQKALFKTGEDGRNMLDRLLEGADKIPMRFSEAFTGAKGAFADWLNSLQSQSEQTEGIFTRMFKKIGQNLAANAELNRAKEYIDSYVAKGMGDKNAKPELYEKPEQQRLVEGLLERRDAKMAEAKRLRELPASNGDVLAGQMREIRKLDLEAEAAQNLIDKYRELADTRSSKQFVSGKATGTPPKAKGPKPHDFAEEGFEFLRDAETKLDAKEEQMGKTEAHIMGIINKANAEGRAISGSLQALWIERAKETDAMLAKLNDKDPLGQLAEKSVQASDERAMKARDAADNADYTKAMEARKKLKKITAKDDNDKEWFDEQRQEILDLIKALGDLPGAADLGAEAMRSLRAQMDARETKKAAAALKELGGEFGQAFKSNVDSALDSLLQFNKSGKEIIEDFVVSFLRSMAKLAMQRAMQPAMDSALGYIGTLASGFFGSSNSEVVTANRIGMHAKGTVLNGATYLGTDRSGTGHVGGEAGPEAVMPLKRDGSGNLGVGAVPVSVTVINNTPAQATTQETSGPNGERMITVMIEETVANALGSGKMDKTLRNSFNLTRKGKG